MSTPATLPMHEVLWREVVWGAVSLSVLHLARDPVAA
jgi:hypothetical protein